MDEQSYAQLMSVSMSEPRTPRRSAGLSDVRDTGREGLDDRIRINGYGPAVHPRAEGDVTAQ